MAGIYVPGLEKPENCICCDLSHEDWWCPAKQDYVDRYSFETCPLVPVPPHGRLIDADAEVARVQNLYNKAVEKDPEMGCVSVYEGEIAVLKLAPTIIPAEEGE